MKHALVLGVALLLPAAGLLAQAETPAEPATREGAGALDRFVESKTPEVIVTGRRFTEGPCWYDGYLVFSDIPEDAILKWTPDEGVSEFRKPSNNTNGNVVDPQGRLVMAQHGRRVERLERDGSVAVLADSYEGKKLNSPNDVVVRSDGAVFFTDPPYGVSAEDRELDFSGVYGIDPSGAITVLDKSMQRPNGVALSPDETRLYVTDSATVTLHVFDLAADGGVSNGRVLAELGSPGVRGIADGMCVDTEGNIWVTGAGGVWIVTPEGERIGRIDVAGASNVCFGGDDGKTLFITARDKVLKLPTRIGGPVAAPEAAPENRPGAVGS